MRERRDMFAVLLALGLHDPELDITLFHQDMVPQHAELGWYLNCVTPVGRLLRMTSWKVRASSPRRVSVCSVLIIIGHHQSKLATLRNANSQDEVDESLLQLGLLAYPVLQTADILLYK